MSHSLYNVTKVGAGVAMVAGLLGPNLVFGANASTTSSSSDPSTYVAPLHPLNRSGAVGFANLTLNSQQPGATLGVSLQASGTEPNQIHFIHIHGSLDGKNAECPTTTADVNHDRLISVFEGAPFYGPIKVSFTSPVTPFGPPSRTDLFAPFAGVPIAANFPHASAVGDVSYNNSIPFDLGNQYATQALTSLTPLEEQHIVIHGGFAPESVDTPGGDPNKIVYDALLPIACGPIIQTHRGSSNENGQNNANQNGTQGGGQGSNSFSIGTTGPGSINSINSNTNNSATISNRNNVSLTNSSTQDSRSGSSSLSGNTNGGNALSGTSSNMSSFQTFINLMNTMFGIR